MKHHQAAPGRARSRGMRRCWLVLLLVAGASLGRQAYGASGDNRANQPGACAVRVREAPVGGFVRALAAGSSGPLWIGTSSGLMSYDGARATAVQILPTPGYALQPAGPLIITRKGGLWASLGGEGLYERRGDRFRTEGLSGQVHGLAEDGQGRLWAAVGDDLFVRQRDRFVRVASDEQATPGHTRLWQRRDGRLFWEHQRRLWAIEGDRAAASQPLGEPYSVQRNRGLLRTLASGFALQTADEERAVDRTIEDLLIDRRGRLWLATRNGLFCTDGRARVWYTDREGLPDTHVSGLVEDGEGNIWARTHGGGLAGLEPAHPQVIVPRQGVWTGTPFSIAQAPDGILWATTSEALLRIDGEGVEGIEPRVGDRRLFPRSMIVTRSGVLYLSTTEPDLTRFDPTSRIFTALPLPDARPDERVSALLEQPDGVLLVGTTRARLLRVAGDRWTVLHAPSQDCAATAPFENGACPQTASALLAGPGGQIWVATFGAGLWSWHDGRFKRLAHPSNDDAPLWSLTPGSNDGVWIGSSRGVGRLRGGAITWYDHQRGLLDPVVFAVTLDGQGRLWMGGGLGVQVVPEADLIAGTARAALFSRTDGLPSDLIMGAYEPASLRSQDGRIWFVTVTGLAAFDPAALADLPPPTATLTGLFTDGRPVARPPGDQVVSVPAGAGELLFQFGAVALRAPQRVHFQYRLEGFDAGWVDAGPRDVAHYVNLKPGDYRFLLRARRPEAQTAGPILATKLHLAPHLWQRPIFIAAMLVALVLAVLGAFALRVRVVRRKYEVITNERRRIALDLHDSLAQVFSAIGFQSDLLLRSPGAEETRSRLEQLRRMVTHARRATRTVVWNLRSTPGDAGALERALNELAGLYEGARVTVRVAGTARALPDAVAGDLLFIAQQAVSNAIEHGGARHVGIEIEYDDRQFALWVRDDGAGFDPAGATEGHEGAHFGLRGMTERAVRAGGQLTVDSTPGVGTEVGVVRPWKAARKERDHG